jgi:hypothetical protein
MKLFTLELKQQRQSLQQVTPGVLLHQSKLFKHPGAAAVLTIAGRLRAGQDIACEPLPACMKHEAQQHLDLQWADTAGSTVHQLDEVTSTRQVLGLPAVCPCTMPNDQHAGCKK